MRACSDAMPSRPRRALQRRALWPSRFTRRGPCNVAMAFRVAGNVHTCSTGKVIAVSTFHDSEFPRRKKKKKSTCSVRKHRGSRTHCTGKLRAGAARILGVLEQFPRTGAGHPDSRLRASPRILEPGQISRSRYRLAESNLRTSPCDLEIERQNTDSKFRDSSFCLRSCTHASPIRHTMADEPGARVARPMQHVKSI